MTYETPPDFPIVCFDNDDWCYVLRDAETAKGWWEPLTSEEMRVVFDASCRHVTVLPEPSGYRFVVTDPTVREAELRDAARAFLQKHRAREINCADLPIDQMLAALARLS